MCGITGIISNNHIKSSLIHSMTNLLEHRGPDQKNYWNNNNNTVLFGHTRLSILDLSLNGLQPMVSSSGRYVITYNGEIYNHIKLRSKLIFKMWKSSSDTETVLEYLEEFGIEKTLASIEGMFSFAVWDNQKEELILARDRMGEKPLYYGIIRNNFIFASELNPIKKNFKKDLDLDDDAISIFLNRGYIPQPLSIFKNIRKLESGCYLIIKKNKITNFEVKTYFDIKNLTDNNDYLGQNFDFYKNTTYNLLDLSVKKQMLSDAPIGAFLSSGIDSSLIAAFMQNNSTNKINTFTIGFEDNNYNESKIAKKISNFIGTNHQELILSKKDLLNIIPKINQVYDEPFADSSQIPTILLSSLASKSVKVCLTGDGADELFGGYQRYLIVSNFIKMSLIIKIPLGIIFKILNKKSIYKILIFVNKFNSKLFKFPIQQQKIDKLFRLFNSKNNNLYEGLMNNFFDNEDLFLNKKLEKSVNEYKYISEPNEFMMNDLVDYLPNDILCKVDRAAMHSSLETRAPFLDHKLVSFTQKIPEKFKVSNFGNKIILRSIQKDLFPKQLCNIKKIGFGVPINSWLKNDLSLWAEDLINGESITNQKILSKSSILKKWSMFKDGNDEFGLSIWYICILQTWLNDFFSN